MVIFLNSQIHYYTAYVISEKHCKIQALFFVFLHYIVRVDNHSLNIISTVFIYSTVASRISAKCSLHGIKHQNCFLILYCSKYNNTIANKKQKSINYLFANSMINKVYYCFIAHCETTSNKI